MKDLASWQAARAVQAKREILRANCWRSGWHTLEDSIWYKTVRRRKTAHPRSAATLIARVILNAARVPRSGTSANEGSCVWRAARTMPAKHEILRANCRRSGWHTLEDSNRHAPLLCGAMTHPGRFDRRGPVLCRAKEKRRGKPRLFLVLILPFLLTTYYPLLTVFSPFLHTHRAAGSAGSAWESRGRG
jgi:hypothetical protein